MMGRIQGMKCVSGWMMGRIEGKLLSSFTICNSTSMAHCASGVGEYKIYAYTISTYVLLTIFCVNIFVYGSFFKNLINMKTCDIKIHCTLVAIVQKLYTSINE
jgi:hypothetical protein